MVSELPDPATSDVTLVLSVFNCPGRSTTGAVPLDVAEAELAVLVALDSLLRVEEVSDLAALVAEEPED